MGYDNNRQRFLPRMRWGPFCMQNIWLQVKDPVPVVNKITGKTQKS